MMRDLASIRIQDPCTLLLYSPLQFAPTEIAKPEGSLSLAYVAVALRQAGYPVRILDCAIGAQGDSLAETFFCTESLESGLIGVSMTLERVVQIVADRDTFGISSIFTPQTSMVLGLIRSLRRAYPDKLIVACGVNARNLRKRLSDTGADLIAMSEAEPTIVSIADAVRGRGTLHTIPGIAFRGHNDRKS